MLTRPRPLPGPDADTFWHHIARRELRLQRCAECGRFRYPPAPCCPGCLSTEQEWVRVAGRGRVLSWVRFHRQYFPTLPAPYVVVVIALDEGPLMVGNVDDASVDALHAGAPVRVAFEECRLEDGSPFVVPQWTLHDR